MGPYGTDIISFINFSLASVLIIKIVYSIGNLILLFQLGLSYIAHGIRLLLLMFNIKHY